MQPNNHIAVFASGTGTTLQALIDNQHTYGYHVALVITNRACQAQERAQAAGIPALLSKDWCEIAKALTDHHVQLIVLAGFLAIIPEWICAKWEHHTINIHPSLLPRHGGKGHALRQTHQRHVCGGFQIPPGFAQGIPLQRMPRGQRVNHPLRQKKARVFPSTAQSVSQHTHLPAF